MSAPVDAQVAPVPSPASSGRPRGRPLVVAVVLVALVLGFVWWRAAAGTAWPEGYGRWAEDVTRGDLAGDNAAVAEVLDAWTHSRGLTNDGVVTTRLLEHPLDDARVVWISLVDGQVTAVVRQQVELTYDRFQDDDIYGTETGYVFGFVRGPTGAPRIQRVSVDWGRPSPASSRLGAWVSLTPPLAVVLDLGTPMQVSTQPLQPEGDGGDYVRTFEPLVFDPDGVAVVDLSGGGDAATVRVGPDDSNEQAYGLLGQPYRSAQVAMGWQPAVGLDESLAVPVSGLRPARDGAVVAFNYAVLDLAGTDFRYSMDSSPWVLAGSTGTGRTVTVGAFAIDSSLRLGLLYGSPEGSHLFDAGALDAVDPLPVAVRLPGGLGWVVGAPAASLSYRAPGTSAWHAVGRQAALLPDADRWEIRVRTADGTHTVVRELAPVG